MIAIFCFWFSFPNHITHIEHRLPWYYLISDFLHMFSSIDCCRSDYGVQNINSGCGYYFGLVHTMDEWRNVIKNLFLVMGLRGVVMSNKRLRG